jgi:hypothetical protein
MYITLFDFFQLGTPLFVAACHGHIDLVKYFVETKSANLEARNLWTGQTPVRIAASQVLLLNVL